MPPPTPIPARLHVIFARESPRAVVFRRGPSKQVASILWNRDNDTFELGQWLKGQIFEHSADVSPDGQWMIYFARDGRYMSDSKGTWTAISRMPYLTAHTFLPKGDTRGGGGLFLDNETYWLDDGGEGYEFRRETPLLRRTTLAPLENIGGLGRYFSRLVRDGWTFLSRESLSAGILEKPVTGGWILRKDFHVRLSGQEMGRGVDFEEHELVSPDGESTHLPDWEWADYDHAGGRDRIVLARGGKLFAIESEQLSISMNTVRELHNFNLMIFEERVAPNASEIRPAR